MTELPPHAVVNREAWTAANAAYTDGAARRSWSRPEITWGLWNVPESELRMLPDFVGRDVIELGCGTAYFGAWLKRAGARRVVGVDVTPAQLATARACDAEFGLGLEFIEANAEAVPLESAQFDLALSEYGASIWCEPEKWIAEAARLLRPGGELVFLRNSTLSLLCMPDVGQVQERLQRPMRALARLEWDDDDPGVEFHPSTSEMFRILRRSGFEVVDIAEVYAPAEAQDHPHYKHFSAEWSKRWPSEEIWRARLREEATPWLRTPCTSTAASASTPTPPSPTCAGATRCWGGSSTPWVPSRSRSTPRRASSTRWPRPSSTSS